MVESSFSVSPKYKGPRIFDHLSEQFRLVEILTEHV